MSKEIHLRYPHMDNFLNDIQRFRTGEKIASFVEIAARKVSRHKKNFKIILYILLTLTAIAAISVWWRYLLNIKMSQGITKQFELAQNYELSGIKDKAIALYKKIIEENPGTKYSRKARMRLDSL